MRDDLLQLKRIEPTNCKKLTAVFLFTDPKIRVGSNQPGSTRCFLQTQGNNQEKFVLILIYFISLEGRCISLDNSCKVSVFVLTKRPVFVARKQITNMH